MRERTFWREHDRAVLVANNPPVASTLEISFRPSRPALRKIREGSTVAILVGRTTQGEGRPARAKSAIGAS